jgi:hypothetical protein
VSDFTDHVDKIKGDALAGEKRVLEAIALAHRRIEDSRRFLEEVAAGIPARTKVTVVKRTPSTLVHPVASCWLSVHRTEFRWADFQFFGIGHTLFEQQISVHNFSHTKAPSLSFEPAAPDTGVVVNKAYLTEWAAAQFVSFENKAADPKNWSRLPFLRTLFSSRG